MAEQLTQKFRANGYNAISIGEEVQEDLCAGRVSIKNYINYEKNSLSKSINTIYNIFDPDIIIVTIDMERDNDPYYLKEIESSFEVDIKINIHGTSNLEVISSYETFKNNAFILNDKSIDDLYDYITNLYDR